MENYLLKILTWWPSSARLQDMIAYYSYVLSYKCQHGPIGNSNRGSPFRQARPTPSMPETFITPPGPTSESLEQHGWVMWSVSSVCVATKKIKNECNIVQHSATCYSLLFNMFKIKSHIHIIPHQLKPSHGCAGRYKPVRFRIKRPASAPRWVKTPIAGWWKKWMRTGGTPMTCLKPPFQNFTTRQLIDIYYVYIYIYYIYYIYIIYIYYIYYIYYIHYIYYIYYIHYIY